VFYATILHNFYAFLSPQIMTFPLPCGVVEVPAAATP
jgi:hypothetical protein